MVERVAVHDKVRHKYHPEWGEGIVVHASRSLVVAEWQYHRQGFALPHSCVEKAG